MARKKDIRDLKINIANPYVAIVSYNFFNINILGELKLNNYVIHQE